MEQARARCRVKGVLGDGGYDSRVNFSYPGERGIEPGIKVRRNSSRRSWGCPARRRAAVEQLGDMEAWKGRVGYGQRWMAEMAFFVYKRLFGEYVAVRSFPSMVREMILKRLCITCL